MKGIRMYSDEHLNAFIDEQLDTKERAELLDALRHDMELSQRVCKLQKTRNLVQLSYQSVEVPSKYQDKPSAAPRNTKGWLAVASVLLLVGTLTGWFANQTLNHNSLLELAQIKQSNPDARGEKTWNLMLHVSTEDPYRLNILLDEAEALLRAYSKTEQKLQLEILTNGKGLSLVSDNGKTYSQRLQDLNKKFGNLAVLACGQALKRYEQTTGHRLKLRPNTQVVPSAVGQVIKRQKEGWTYIRI